MFNARVSFTLSVITSSGTRFLSSEVTGDGVQDGIALGTYSKESKMSDFLAKFYCEAYDVKEGFSQVQIKNLYLTQTNGKIEPIEIPIPQTYEGKDISQYDDNTFENNNGKDKTLYLFIQKVNSNERRLSDVQDILLQEMEVQ